VAHEDGNPLAGGWQALERDDLRAAEAAARAALASAPQDGEALYLLGSSLLFQNRYQEAAAPLERALQLAPRRGVGHRLGYCRLALGDFKRAEELLRREMEGYPDAVDACNALGVALVNQGRREDALAAFLEAARRDPRSASARNNVANVLGDLGRNEEALPHLRAAVELEPGLADAHHNLGILLHGLKRHEEAIGSLEQALRLAPASAYTLSHLVWNQLAVCRWDGLAERIASLRRQVSAGSIAAEPFVLVAVSDSPAEQKLCAERHTREKMPRLPAPPSPGARRGDAKIRLAYLSADYHAHATAELAAGLFERHDRSRFELIGVSYGADDGSPMRRRLERAFDRFVDVQAEGDEAAARRLHALQVGIAVDLKGYTTSSRPALLAHRLAPVQVAYLGFPATCGAPFIDYVLADRVVIPPEEQRFWSEKVAYLPGSYQVNDGTRAIAARTPARAEAGLPQDAFVFCCFNNNYKILPPVFAVWMRLLREVRGSVLWLLEGNAAASRNLRAAAQAAGVEPARLVFAPRLPPDEHLARHRLADLFLDTLPYNAHTTASDALWAGLPLLTCAGTTFAGRVAASLLRAVGLPELVTASLEEYEAAGRRLAADPGLLRAVREKLARQRLTAPLFDTDRFRRHVEAAYATMWERWQRGAAPQGFTVAEVGE
jgi:predicted O-linked N-acetylglucosamine transferase (SPINDLY family)